MESSANAQPHANEVTVSIGSSSSILVIVVDPLLMKKTWNVTGTISDHKTPKRNIHRCASPTCNEGERNSSTNIFEEGSIVRYFLNALQQLLQNDSKKDKKNEEGLKEASSLWEISTKYYTAKVNIILRTIHDCSEQIPLILERLPEAILFLCDSRSLLRMKAENKGSYLLPFMKQALFKLSCRDEGGKGNIFSRSEDDFFEMRNHKWLENIPIKFIVKFCTEDISAEGVEKAETSICVQPETYLSGSNILFFDENIIMEEIQVSEEDLFPEEKECDSLQDKSSESENSGIARLVEALFCHIWPGLKRIDGVVEMESVIGNKNNTDSFFLNEDSSDRDLITKEFKYDIPENVGRIEELFLNNFEDLVQKCREMRETNIKYKRDSNDAKPGDFDERREKAEKLVMRLLSFAGE